MTNLFMMLLSLLSGLGVGVQAAVNGALGKRIGTIEGAFISFFMGTIVLTLVLLLVGKGNVLEVFRVPKWQLLGGVLGAIYVFVMVMAVPVIGVGSALISVIVGQIVMSMLIDHFGWFGSPRIPLDLTRVAGIGLLALALFLIFRSGR